VATFTTHVIVGDDGTVTVNGLPLQSGEKVQVVVKTVTQHPDLTDPYPLRHLSKGYYYFEPFRSVAIEDWECLR